METTYTIIMVVILILIIVVFLLATYSSAVQGSDNTNNLKVDLLELMGQLKDREHDLQEFMGWQRIKPWPREFLYTEIDSKTSEAFNHAQDELNVSLHNDEEFSLREVAMSPISWRGLLSLGSNLNAIAKYQANLSILEKLREHLHNVERELENLHTLQLEIQRINERIADDLSDLEQQARTATTDLEARNDLVYEARQVRLPLESLEKCTTQARTALARRKTINNIQFAQANIWLQTGTLFLRLSILFDKKVSVASLYKMDLLEVKLQTIRSLLDKSMENDMVEEFGLLRLKSLHLEDLANQISMAETSFEEFSSKRMKLEEQIDEVKNLNILEKIARVQKAERELQAYWGTLEESAQKWQHLLDSDKMPSRLLQSNRNHFQMLMPQLDNIFESKIPEILNSLTRALGEIQLLMEQETKILKQTHEEKRAEINVKAALAENGSAKKAIDNLNKILSKCEPDIARRIEELNETYLSIHERAQVQKTADYPSLIAELSDLKQAFANIMEEHESSMHKIQGLAAKLDTNMVQLQIKIAGIEDRLPSSKMTYGELMTMIRNVNSAYAEAQSSDEYVKYSKYVRDTRLIIKELVSDIADIEAEIEGQHEAVEELKQKVGEVESSIHTRVAGISEIWKKPLSEILLKINEQKADCQLYRDWCGQLEQGTLKQAGDEIEVITDGLAKVRILSNKLIGDLHEAQTALINKEAKIEEWIEDLKDSGQEPHVQLQLREAQNNLQQARNTPELSWAIHLLDATLGRMTSGPNYYVNRPISVGNIERNRGPVVVGDHNDLSTGLSEQSITKLFAEMRLTANRLSDLNKQIEAQKAIRQLEAEVRKGERANEEKITKWFDFLFEISKDVWEVAVATFLNPMTGLALVFKKVAERAKSKGKINSDSS